MFSPNQGNDISGVEPVERGRPALALPPAMRHAIVAAVLAFSAACSGGDRGPMPPAAVERLDPSGPALSYEIRSASPREDAIIRRIIAHYQGPDKQAMEMLLRDSRASEHTTSNKLLRPLFDSLNAVRRLDHEDKAKSAADRVNSHRASVILVDRLPDSTASSVVIRYADSTKSDVILLSSGRATVAEFGPAIAALIKLRRAPAGQQRHGTQLVVKGRGVPVRWSRALVAQAERDLEALKRQPIGQIEGVGPGRKYDVYVVR